MSLAGDRDLLPLDRAARNRDRQRHRLLADFFAAARRAPILGGDGLASAAALVALHLHHAWCVDAGRWELRLKDI